jgi:hypothetical protein
MQMQPTDRGIVGRELGGFDGKIQSSGGRFRGFGLGSGRPTDEGQCRRRHQGRRIAAGD